MAISDYKITIALPCYNAGCTIENTVRSIIAQTYADWELLALNDGSTDNTVEILRQFDDPRIRIIDDGTNRGRCYRLNQAAKLATGKYYARMDSDDLMFPERLAKQVAFLEENPDVDLLGGGVVSIDEELNPLGIRLAPECVESAFEIFKGEVLYHPTVMGRTSWFQKHPYIEGYLYSDDFASWTKYAADLRIANLQQPLIFYLEHGLFTYEKYIGRRCETKQAIRTFGPAIIGPYRTHALLWRRHLKDLVYSLFHKTGCWKLTLKLVNQRLPDRQSETYRKVIRQMTGAG